MLKKFNFPSQIVIVTIAILTAFLATVKTTAQETTNNQKLDQELNLNALETWSLINDEEVNLTVLDGCFNPQINTIDDNFTADDFLKAKDFDFDPMPIFKK